MIEQTKEKYEAKYSPRNSVEFAKKNQIKIYFYCYSQSQTFAQD